MNRRELLKKNIFDQVASFIILLSSLNLLKYIQCQVSSIKIDIFLFICPIS